MFALLLMFSVSPASAKTYKIGDVGPRGGVVFYVLHPETQSLWHYLEVAPNNWNQGNVSRLSFLNASKRVNRYDDGSWFIPAKEDMEQIYKNRKLLKSISFWGDKYWTSTGTSMFTDMSVVNMKTGSVYIDSGSGLYVVRPIRYF